MLSVTIGEAKSTPNTPMYDVAPCNWKGMAKELNQHISEHKCAILKPDTTQATHFSNCKFFDKKYRFDAKPIIIN